MKMELWYIGKTSDAWIETGISVYEKRLKHYVPFQQTLIPDVKGKFANADALKKEEARAVLAKLSPDDALVLLDEHGEHFRSVAWAAWIEKKMSASPKRLVFLIGGAYGFAPELYARAQHQLALSHMTFSHQMIRLFFMEQLYRAMTILRNEPYHNE